MSTRALYQYEIWHECRAGLRGPMVPIIFIGLIGYLLLVLVNAEYMREMGALEVPRNSAHLLFLMTAGQSVWLFFAWAWVFSQIVLRDRNANLHENVLCAPVSLTGLLLARYVGALLIAVLIGMAMPLGILLVPVLGWLGWIAPDLVGPHPWPVMGWSMVIFVIPSAIGLGALYTVTALWTRSSLGPFVVAAILMLIWMVGMVVLREGGISPFLATLFDPTAYAEAELQINQWTPSEKIDRLLALSPALITNRLVWMGLPLLALGLALRHLNREQLVIGHSRQSSRRRTVALQNIEQTPSLALANPAWLLATWHEAIWHLRLSVGQWGLLFALAMLTFVGVGGTFVHLLQHSEGPIVPRAAVLAPFLINFSYLFVIFMVAGFVGALARRDQRQGFSEWVDVMPAPLGCRVLGRVLAAFILTGILALAPTLSAWMIMLIAAPAGESYLDPLWLNALTLAPALLEICALTLLAHALLRNAGAAYALSMIIAFIAVINHEVGLVAYPPAQFGVPAHLSLSALAGWSPWLANVSVTGVFKLTLVGIVVGLVWLVWQRGTDWRWWQRWLAARQRYAAMGMIASSGLLASVIALQLHYRLISAGEFQSSHQQIAEATGWEQHWWQQAGAFTVTGGKVAIQVEPSAQTAKANWLLHGVTSATGYLHGSLPHGVVLDRVLIEQQFVKVETAYNHFAVPLGACASSGCEVLLLLNVNLHGWSHDDTPTWLNASGVWLRATDVLPSLGFDPAKLWRVPTERTQAGLAAQPPQLPAAEQLRASHAVAPAGHWQWEVQFMEAGEQTATTGQLNAPLDFAVAWLPQVPPQLQHGEITIWHGVTHTATAQAVLADLTAMQQCVNDMLGATSVVTQVLQSPRQLGEPTLYHALLWLPEDAGWDVGDAGFGRWHRRQQIATALSQRWLTNQLDLRAEAGSAWVATGVAGWVGLHCVRQTDGMEAWLALQRWYSEQLVTAFSALPEPVITVAETGATEWLQYYTPLAISGWAGQVGAETVLAHLQQLLASRADLPTLVAALEAIIGQPEVAILLGLPFASDVALSTASTQQLTIANQRWQWQAGGWQATDTPLDVVVFQAAHAPQRIANSAQLDATAPLVVFDAFPSFERTLEDNVWQ